MCLVIMVREIWAHQDCFLPVCRVLGKTFRVQAWGGKRTQWLNKNLSGQTM
jgi:hypothetical protein